MSSQSAGPTYPEAQGMQPSISFSTLTLMSPSLRNGSQVTPILTPYSVPKPGRKIGSFSLGDSPQIGFWLIS